MSALNDKVALVTGSSRGIGAAIARLFAQQGAKVAVHGRDTAALAAVQADIERAGGTAMPVVADITRFAEIEAMRQEIERELGPIEILIANAGGSFTMPGPLEQTSSWPECHRRYLGCYWRGSHGLKGKIMKQGERADYGIDAPSVIRNLAVSGVVCLLIALASPPLRWFFSPAVSLLATAAVWLYNSKLGKLRLREKLIDTLTWSGSETVLDVGCGSGLLLIAAAKRLTDGMAVGVDIWRQEDLSNNRRETTLRNARVEGVSERVRVEEGNARQLPFGDATFDVVVSLNVLHNIARREEREQALMEIIRVLQPGGRFLIADFRNTGEYARVLREQGIGSAQRKRIGWVCLFPVFAAVGSKPLDK